MSQGRARLQPVCCSTCPVAEFFQVVRDEAGARTVNHLQLNLRPAGQTVPNVRLQSPWISCLHSLAPPAESHQGGQAPRRPSYGT